MKRPWLFGRLALLATVMAGTLVMATDSPSGADELTVPTTAAWQGAISHTPLPGIGCFIASYPAVAWQASQCKVAPKVTFGPSAGLHSAKPFSPDVVGNGNDYSAVMTSGIDQATGSFTGVSRNIAESGQNGGTGPQIPNTYSLQLNTQRFSTPECVGASDPSACRGWEQFVYDSYANSVYIQYWLLGYDEPCPSTWMTFDSDCYSNSGADSLPSGSPNVGELDQVRFSGSAVAPGGPYADGFDGVSLTDGTQAAGVGTVDTVLDLGSHWTTSEFGIFGDGGGGQANFTTGSKLETQTTLLGGGESAPACVNEGFTAETNNLSLTGTPAIGTVGLPTIGSAQTEGRASSTSCATAAETPETFEISSVTPKSVTNAGGKTLTINGTGFLDVVGLYGSSVTFGSSYASAPVTVESDTQATITAPAATGFTGTAYLVLDGCLVAAQFSGLCLSQEAWGSFKYKR
jgi:IPT/TIG domain